MLGANTAVAVVIILLLGAGLLHSMVAQRSGSPWRFRMAPIACLVVGPLIAGIIYFADFYFSLTGHHIPADIREELPPILFIGLIAGTLVAPVLWIVGDR